MQKSVRVIEGSYKNQPVLDTIFPVVKELTIGTKKRFITVDGSAVFGPDKPIIRIKVSGPESIEMIEDGSAPIEIVQPPKETLEEAISRIRERFSVLNEMTMAVAMGHVRGMVVTGPPGVGKSFGIDETLKQAEAVSLMLGDYRFDPEKQVSVVKGAMSPIGLYKTLYENKDPRQVLVLDDCDSVLFDEVSLNMLKAALDSGKRRTISWNTESRTLKQEDMPNTFEFKGAIIFVTNLKFDYSRRSKISDHLDAIMSRCHYMDLALDTLQDCILRCKQIVNDGMLKSYNFTPVEEMEVMEFIEENAPRMREVSLRMVTKVADLKRMTELNGGTNWKRLAEMTCMKRVSRV
jgi:hypothetical protein